VNTTPPQPLASDFLCIACQYNLRTRTPNDRCPECGLPVAQTIAHRRRHAHVIQDPRLFRLACYCLAIPSLACWVYILFYWVLEPFAARAPGAVILTQYLLRELGQLAFLLALLTGTLFFLYSVSTQVVSAAHRTAATVLATAYSILSTLALLVSLALLYGGKGGLVLLGLAILRGQRIGIACVCLVLAVGGYFVLQRLAKALADERLAVWARWALAAVIADSGVSLGIYLALAVWQFLLEPQPFRGVFLVLDGVSAVIFVGFGLFWLFVARTVPRRDGKPGAESSAPQAATASPSALLPHEKIEAFLGSRKAGPVR
jgi:hypothetical protein